MHVYRQSLWLCLWLGLSACSSIDPMAMAFNTSPFSQSTQAKGNAYCATLYANRSFGTLQGKMPVMPGELPTRAMLQVTTAPEAQEIAAIQSLESAMRTCRQLRAAAGVPASATEDILAARLSKLRFGLYKGDIPYAVYNYGAVQAMRSHNAFILSAEQASQKGREIGGAKAQQIALQAQINSLRVNLDSFESRPQMQSWTCTGTRELTCY